MALTRINLLHVTDLHASNTEMSESVGDVKDTSLSAPFCEEMRFDNNLQLVLSRSRAVLQDADVDFIVCSGDLGMGGNKDSGAYGADFLEKIAQRSNVPNNRVVVAPGNHDADRTAENGDSLASFNATCDAKGFLRPNGTVPLCFVYNGVGFVALNTCLGATESALFPTSKTLLGKIADSLTSLVGVPTTDSTGSYKFKKHDLDIPAIGKTQADTMGGFLKEHSPDCTLVLCHHNLFPPPYVEVRPYGNVVDGGVFLASLNELSRNVVVLHGHTHCDYCFIARNLENPKCMITTIGGHGLHGAKEASVNYVQLILDKNGLFLGAYVRRYKKSGGDTFMAGSSFYIPSHFDVGDIHEVEINKLPRNTKQKFATAAGLMGLPADDDTAAALLRIAGWPQIQITNIEQSIDNWNVMHVG